MTDSEHPFDAYYFAHGCGRPYQRDEEWLGFFDGIAERIVEEIQPATALDAGCAMGFLVEALRKRGVEAWGVDVSEYAIERAHPEVRPYCWVGSITEPFPQSYDLIVSIEVLEHMPPEESVQAVRNLCAHTDDVLFSSSPVDYKEVTHFNVQPPEHWAALFAQNGFFRDVDFDARFIIDWAARFRRRDEPVHRIVRDYERRFWELWKANTEMRAQFQEMRARMAEDEQALQELNTQISYIYQSRSWRLLEPLRRLRSWLTRR